MNTTTITPVPATQALDGKERHDPLEVMPYERAKALFLLLMEQALVNAVADDLVDLTFFNPDAPSTPPMRADDFELSEYDQRQFAIHMYWFWEGLLPLFQLFGQNLAQTQRPDTAAAPESR